MSSDFKVCMITAPSSDEAKRLARLLLEAKAAACVNLVPQVTSLYWWEGAVQEDSEVLMIVKTRQHQVDAVIELVRKNHPYQVAEVISLPIEAGNPSYLQWIQDSLAPC